MITLEGFKAFGFASHFKELKSDGDCSSKYTGCLMSLLLAPGVLARLTCYEQSGKEMGTIPH